MGKAGRLLFSPKFVCEITRLGGEGIAAKPLLRRQYNSVGRDLSSLYGRDFRKNSVKTPIKGLFLHFLTGEVDAPPFAKYPAR